MKSVSPRLEMPVRRVGRVRRTLPALRARTTRWSCAALPLPDAPEDEAAARHGRASGAATRVLVVDDEAAVRMICAFNLQAAGLDVSEAVDGDEAMAAVRAERPDLVLLDVMMPNRDGWAVASELHADPATRDIPVVFLTARVDRGDRQRAYELGAVGYITKPFDPVDLAARLARVLERIGRGEREQLREDVLRNRDA
jgi:CheY-like chemotaxis protein